MDKYPDVKAEFTAGKFPGMTIEQAAQLHYTSYGKGEGRTGLIASTPTPAPTPTPGPSPTPTPAPQLAATHAVGYKDPSNPNAVTVGSPEWRASLKAQADASTTDKPEVAFYKAAKAGGWTAYEIDTAMGWPGGTFNNVAANNGLGLL